MATRRFTIPERAFLFEEIAKNKGRYTAFVKQQFQARFPQNRLPHRKTVAELVNRFRDTGSVADFIGQAEPRFLMTKSWT